MLIKLFLLFKKTCTRAHPSFPGRNPRFKALDHKGEGLKDISESLNSLLNRRLGRYDD